LAKVGGRQNIEMARIPKLPVIEDVERFGPEFECSSLPQLRTLLKSYVRFPNIGSANNSVPYVSEMSINPVCISRGLREGSDVYPIVRVLVWGNDPHTWNNVRSLVRSRVAEWHLSRIQTNRDGQRMARLKHA
jgi:hypothetical protein